MTKTTSLYHGHRFPAAVISYAVLWYVRFQLSLLDIEELLFERGVIVSYVTIRRWCDKAAAKRFFKHVLTTCPDGPRRIVTDQLPPRVSGLGALPRSLALSRQIWAGSGARTRSFAGIGSCLECVDDGRNVGLSVPQRQRLTE